MATLKQRDSARKNIKKAQSTWQGMDRRQRAKSQPEGRARASIGSSGEGNYYRIEVRPKKEFTTFRYHDVGEKGHLLRLAGKRESGSWGTAAWLIAKNDAHVAGRSLVPDTREARNLIDTLGRKPVYRKGDVFEAKERRAVAGSEKSSGSTSARKTGTTSASKTTRATGSSRSTSTAGKTKTGKPSTSKTSAAKTSAGKTSSSKSTAGKSSRSSGTTGATRSGTSKSGTRSSKTSGSSKSGGTSRTSGSTRSRTSSSHKS